MNTLNFVFDWVIVTGLRASLLVLAVLAVQWLLKNRLPSRWRYALWLPVLVALLVPALPVLPSWMDWPTAELKVEALKMAAPPAPPAPPAPVSAAMSVAMTAVSLPESMERAEVPAMRPRVIETTSAATTLVQPPPTPKPVNWRAWLMAAWLIGTAGLSLFVLASFALTMRRIRGTVCPVETELLARIAHAAKTVGLRRVPRLLKSSAVASPAVCGLWRPTLLLNERFPNELSAEESDLVLRHELTHIRRGDLALNALLCALLALHWFNPLLWLAFSRVRSDREAACDAQVLDGAPDTRRAAYGHTLLKMETEFPPTSLCLGLVGILERGCTLRERIHAIISQPQLKPIMKTTIALCIAALTSAGVIKAAEKQQAVVLGASAVARAEEKKDIVDTALGAGNFKTLVAAVKAAGLIETLKGEGPFTVFAPTDEAFAKLPKGPLFDTVGELLKPENKGKLADLLKDHVISGKVALGKALEAGEATTLQGSKIPAKFAGGRVLIGPAGLLTADIAASNGVIHVIDQVLLPKTWGESNVSLAGTTSTAQEDGHRRPARPQPESNSCNKCHDSSVSFGQKLTPDPDAAMELLASRIVSEKPMITDGNQRRKTLELGGEVTLELVWIPAGKFVMGSNNGNPSEQPLHVVAITKGFWMGKTEVTQAQYKQLMGTDPSEYKSFRDDLPVERVSWEDAVKFCAKLQGIAADSGKVRLPTEAEWEYACRAGTTGHYNVEPVDAAAWFARNTAELHGPRWSTPPFTQPVAQKKPNAWGLYDMHGNVWEWCSDWYGQDYYRHSPAADPQGPDGGRLRVRRGGSWCSFTSACRSSQRPDCPQLPLESKIGFRVVVAPEGSDAAAEVDLRPSGTSAGVVATLLKDGRFATLTAALAKADLADTFAGEGKFTVFAPTDEAFALLDKALGQVGEGTVQALLNPDNQPKLREILRYHVVAGEQSVADAMNSKTLKTLQGETVTVALSKGKVRVNQAAVLDGNVRCANGMIHVIDRVLTPSPKPAGLLTADIAASNGVIHVIDQVLLPKTWGESNVPRIGPFPYRYGKLVSYRYAYCPAPEAEKQNSQKAGAAQSCNACHVLPAASFPEMWRNLYVGFDPKKKDAECATPNLFRWVRSGAGAMFGDSYAVNDNDLEKKDPPAPVTVKVGQEFDIELYTFINQEGARWYPGARPRHSGEEAEGFNIHGPNKALPELTNESVVRVGEISKAPLSGKTGETYDVCYSDSKFGKPTAGAFFNPAEKFGVATTCGKYLVRYRAVKAGTSEIRWQLQREEGKGLVYFAEYVLPVKVE